MDKSVESGFEVILYALEYFPKRLHQNKVEMVSIAT